MAKPIQGTQGDDLFILGTGILGTDKHDRLQGKGGDDDLTGGKGDDDIDGGQGVDTAHYGGSFFDFDIIAKGTGNDKLTVIDNNSSDGNEGIDSLKHVEYLQFSDGTYNVATGDVWTYVADGALDEAAQEPGTDDMINGSGIPADHFGIVRNEAKGVELALKVHHREGPPDYTTTDDYADGVLHFQVEDGPRPHNSNQAEWNLDWSIATGLNGETTDLDDFTFKLLVDVDPSADTDYMTWQLEPDTVPPNSLTPHPDDSGYQWENLETGQVEPWDDQGNSNVTQNSQNFGFGWIQQHIDGYGPANGFAGPAYFDIQLQALDDSGNLIAQNHISVDVIL